MNPQIGFFLSSALQYLQSGNLRMAEKFLNQVRILDKKNVDALRLLGVLAAKEGRLEEALTFFHLVIKISPKNGVAYSNLGNVYLEKNNFKAALSAYDQAVAFDPNYSEAHNNRGNALQKMMRFSLAVISYDKAIALDPQCAQFYTNRANALKELKQYDEALASYQYSLHLNSQDDVTWVNLGNMLCKLKNYEKAFECFENAVATKPDSLWAYGSMLFNAACIFKNNHFDSQLSILTEKISKGLKVIAPHALLSLSDEESLQRQAAEIWSSSWYPTPPSKTLQTPKQREKIRIAYYSSDFRTHPVSQLMVGLLEAHDKSRFEVFGFSYAQNAQDDMTGRLIESFDQFINITAMSDEEVANLSKEHAIDIAIDLTGHTESGRPGIFAHRAAPIQVNYLGYAGTMGAPYYDYIIANEVLIPPQSQQFFSENIIYLPDMYMADDPKRAVSTREFSRSELGLPEKGFIFCCFNNSFKMNIATIRSWANILHKVNESVLWLSDNNEVFKKNLVEKFSELGIDTDRIIFAKRLPLAEEHLSRHRLAGLFLDTSPYNAHTTAVDALKAGLPIVTLQGRSFASRVASSLLNTIGVPELITHSTKEYEELAIALAIHPERLNTIAKKIAARSNASLFNPIDLIKNIEAAYLILIEQHSKDSPPEHVFIKN